MSMIAYPDYVSLPGSSGRRHVFEVSRWANPHPDTPSVYALLSYHGGADSADPTVLYVGESENLDAALSVHGEYPCMETFVDAVGSLHVAAAAERTEIRDDLNAGQRPPCEGCWPPIPVGPEGTVPYPDRVVGGCVAEQLLLDRRIESAVRRSCVIRFVHDRKHCEVEPHAYGIGLDGHSVLFAYQTSFGAGAGSIEPWKTFRLTEIHGLVITDRPCGGARPSAESQIAVTFTQSEGVARRTARETVEGEPPGSVDDLRRRVEVAVDRLRHQVFELRRIEADCARLEHRIALADAPPEVASLLAVVQAEQPRMQQELLDLIPEVATLQRQLSSFGG